MPEDPRALIVGCGDIGLRIAWRLQAGGIGVQALTRTPEAAARAAATGVPCQAQDLDREPPLLPEAGHIFYCAPPPPQGRSDPRLRRLLQALGRRPARLLYLSTSGVYGDCQGRWIDEDEPLKPATDRARRRADAEAALAQAAADGGFEFVVLRVAGIYGPGRLPLERLHSGQPVLDPAQAPWSNRIHADDLAEAARLAMQRGRAGAAYNAADGAPSSMSDYFLRCAALLGLPQPALVDREQAQAVFPETLRSYLAESRRLRVDRLRALGWSPRYPDLASGLPGCLPD